MSYRLAKLMCTLLICVLAARAGFAQGSDPVRPLLESSYASFQKCLDKGDYKGARDAALKLASSPQWKMGNLEVAGALRGMADELRSRNHPDLADEVLAGASKTTKVTGDSAIALDGRQLSRGVIKKKVFFSVSALNRRGAFDPAVDLPRIRVGNQATILKIVDARGGSVFFKGIDAMMWAPILEEHRTAIFNVLGVSSPEQTAQRLMDAYPSLKEKKEAIAVIGCIGSTRNHDISDAMRQKILLFLMARVADTSTTGDEGATLRRQACLNLALQDALTKRTVNTVVDFYDKSSNVWETFPVQQFFEYQAPRVHKLDNLAEIKARVGGIKSLYTENINRFL